MPSCYLEGGKVCVCGPGPLRPCHALHAAQGLAMVPLMAPAHLAQPGELPASATSTTSCGSALAPGPEPHPRYLLMRLDHALDTALQLCCHVPSDGRLLQPHSTAACGGGGGGCPVPFCQRG